MSSDFLIESTRAAWLTLAFMMLFSRGVFQAVGAVRMRTFLQRWQRGRVKRIWGGATLAFGAFLVAGLVSTDSLHALDLVLAAGLVALLAADGLVNVLPAGFETFKDRLQKAWVRRTSGSGWESDSRLFGSVNAVLAAAAAGIAAFVATYRPISAQTVVVALVAAAVLTAALISATVVDLGPQRKEGRVSSG
jgi:hypothetical protein